MTDYPSQNLQIITVGKNSFSDHLGAKLFTDTLFNSRTCMIERDEDTFDLAFVPDVDIVTHKDRTILLFVDMRDGMSYDKLTIFLKKLKAKNIPVILYASVGTLLSMASSASDVDEFNRVRDISLTLRESLFALFLMPFDFTMRLIVDWGVQKSVKCYPTAAILFGQDWYKTTTKTPELFADIAYVVIQSYSMKTETYEEKAPIITKDFVRTLTRQISPPIRYLVFVAGNEDLTVSEAEYILTRAYPDEDTVFTTGTILDNALADNIGLILGFGYSLEDCFQDSVGDQAEQKTFEINCARHQKGLIHVRDIPHDRTQEIVGLSSGFSDLDRLTSGFQNSDLIIIASRSDIGKTALGLNIILDVAIRQKKNVGIFSLQLSKEALFQRLLCSESEINLDKAEIYLDDTASTNAMQVRAKARQMRLERGLDLILIDYLQLMKGPKTSYADRNQEIAEIVRLLKTVAWELNVPLIVLSQLSCVPEQRTDKTPVLADLGKSSEIEESADLVIFLHREEDRETSASHACSAELIVAKNRNGRTGSAEILFMKEFAKFVPKEHKVGA